MLRPNFGFEDRTFCAELLRLQPISSTVIKDGLIDFSIFDNTEISLRWDLRIRAKSGQLESSLS